MRKFLISLLLASAAASPAVAAPDDDSARQQAREERKQVREQARSGEAEQAPARVHFGTVARSDESSPPERQQRAIGSEKGSGVQDALRSSPGAGENVAQGRRRPASPFRIVQPDGAEPVGQAETIERDRGGSGSVTDWRKHERRVSDAGAGDLQGATAREGVRSGTLRQSDRPVPYVLRNRAPIVSSAPREGTQPPLRAERRRTSPVNWSSHWRSDRRYDWYHWRSRNRSLFRLGFYSDPFGWNYRPYSIGWRLWPSYYSRNYWLNDPWQYRLPYAPPGYRWIRYWDDAILVDTWNGQVVDVIYNFFW